MSLVQIENLTFDYPTKRALFDVSLEIQPETITALVGPNGAGKSTLMKCLAGLQSPIEGSIHIDGIDVIKNPREAHKKVGFLPDFFGLYSNLTVKQSLEYFALAYEIPKTDISSRIDTMLGLLQLEKYKETLAGELSRGLKQRLAIGQAIIHYPKLVILDEPASGLDPEARKSLSDLFLHLRDEGLTLLISSHILAELEEYSSHLMIIRDGKLLSHDIVQNAEGDQIRMQISFLDGLSEIMVFLQQQDNVKKIEMERENIQFDLLGDPKAQHTLLQNLTRCLV